MATFCSNCDEMLCSCSHPNQVPRYELEERMTCEWAACKKYATQADTYQNMWLCDNHYSYIATVNEDYQGKALIEYEDIIINKRNSK